MSEFDQIRETLTLYEKDDIQRGVLFRHYSRPPYSVLLSDNIMSWLIDILPVALITMPTGSSTALGVWIGVDTLYIECDIGNRSYQFSDGIWGENRVKYTEGEEWVSLMDSFLPSAKSVNWLHLLTEYIEGNRDV